jgi:hypothetical protein
MLQLAGPHTWNPSSSILSTSPCLLVGWCYGQCVSIASKYPTFRVLFQLPTNGRSSDMCNYVLNTSRTQFLGASFLSLLLLLILPGPNWGQWEMQKGQTIDRHTESWGQVCWVLEWRRKTALLLFSFSSLYSASFLYLYSLRPCSKVFF